MMIGGAFGYIVVSDDSELVIVWVKVDATSGVTRTPVQIIQDFITIYNTVCHTSTPSPYHTTPDLVVPLMGCMCE